MKTDRELQADILDELGYEPVLSPAEIGVAVKNGIVTLSGNVDTSAKKIAAEEAARRVHDVRGIAEEITVIPSFYGHRTDEQIAEAVVDTLKLNNIIPKDHIGVKVDRGWLTLSGKLPWQFQKDAATRAVSDMIGVKGVTNRIEVQNRTNIPVFTEHIHTPSWEKKEEVYKAAAKREYSVFSIIFFVVVVAVGLTFSIGLFFRLFQAYKGM